MKSIFPFIVFTWIALNSCCTDRENKIQTGEFRSREFNAVNVENLPISGIHDPGLFFAPDSLTLDSMIKKGMFDTSGGNWNKFRAIDFKRSSYIVGNLWHYGDFKGYQCFVNHKTKEISVAVAWHLSCTSEKYLKDPEFVSFLIPKLPNTYKLIP